MSPRSSGPSPRLATFLAVLALLPVAVFAIWVGVLVWLISSLSETAASVAHTDQVLAGISRLESQAFGEIVAVRGYLISGSDSFLSGYPDREQVERAATALRGVVRDSPAQQARVNAYRDTWRAWRDVADAEIAARRAGGDVVGLLHDKSEPLEQKMRQTAEAMRAEEDGLRVERVNHDATVKRRTLVFTTVAGLLLGTILAVLSVRAVRRVVADYELTYEQLRSDAAKLAGAEHQLREYARELERRVAQRTKELAVANAQLEDRRADEEANRIKNEFLATVSHELRTPLHAITGWFHVLKSQQKEQTPASSRAIEAIDRNTALLGRVVEDLMDNARILSRKLTLAPHATSLEEAVRRAIEGVNVGAAQKNIPIRLIAEAGLPPVWGDPGRLQQVFWNLLANAVKFTPDRGRIDVSVRGSEDHVVVRITDTGQGITPEFLPHVFDRFTQEDSGTARVFPGLGLGLALVRYLVEAHYGEVEARSDGHGTGATFIVRIPIATEEAQRQLPA